MPGETTTTTAVRLDVDYPDRDLNRISTLLRLFYALPIVLISALLTGGVSAGGVIFIPTALMIAVRHRYPAWWMDYNLALAGFGARVAAYVLCMDDRYPSTEDPQSIHLTLPRPIVERDLNPPLAVVKWLLAVPHYVVLAVLWLAGVGATVAAWFCIVVTGRYPRWAFDYLTGVMRWHLRVWAYAFLLVSDEYPPFSLRLAATAVNPQPQCGAAPMECGPDGPIIGSCPLLHHASES